MLVKEGQAESVQGVGLPPLVELLKEVNDAKVRIYVCTPCAEARKLQQGECVGNITFSTAVELVRLATEGSVLSF